jgi:ribose transport system substrate-binding protein
LDIMRRSSRGRLVGVAWLAVVWFGCDSGEPAAPSAPTRPLEATAADGTSAEAGTSAPAEAKAMVMVFPGKPHMYEEIWERTARAEASGRKVRLDTLRPEPGDPPSKQADLIRRALADRPSALVVLADEDPAAVAPAVEEARDQGVPVVLLERPVPVRGKPVHLVTFGPIREATRAMVKAGLETIKAGGQPADSPILVLAHEAADSYVESRLAELLAALKDAGGNVLPTMTYRGNVPEATQAILSALEAHPKLALVFALDDRAISGGTTVRYGHRPELLLAGFAVERKTMELVAANQCLGLVDINAPALARRAIEVALDLAQGKSHPERVELEVRFRLAPNPLSGKRFSGPRARGTTPG